VIVGTVTGMVTGFETERLVVRKATLADVESVLRFLSDAETVRLFGSGAPWSRAAVEQFVCSYPDGDPALASAPGLALLKPSLEPVGFGGVGYYVAPGNTADLLFVLDRAYWGQGLATELARAAVATAFGHPAITTIWATVHPANAASLRVLEKCGLTYERALPEHNRLLYRIERPASPLSAS
jgi:[ribosomal protein S5]-alanine N-acetyltransferase